MREFQGIKCPKCGKKGLSYASHPHARGYKDYERLSCRYCGVRFPVAHLTQRAIDAGDSATSQTVPNAGAIIKSDGSAVPTQRN